VLACVRWAGASVPASSVGFTPAELAGLGLPRPAEVLVLREAVPAADPVEESRLALLRAGFRLEGGNDAEPAYADWLAHEALSPGRPEATLGLGLAALANHLPKSAWEIFRRIRTTSRSTAIDDRAAFWEGEAAWQLGEDAAAVRAFAEVLDRYRGSPLEGSAAYRLGWIESSQGSTEAALAHFELAGKLDPSLVPSASLQRGWVLLQAGRTPEAKAIFDAAAADAAEPDSRRAQEALVGQAECAYRAEDFAGADRLFDAALARAPDARAKAPLRYSLGWAALRQRQFQRARATFLSVVRDYPEEPPAPFAAYRAALCLLDLGKPDDAVLELKDVGARWPAHEVGEWAAYSRGWIHLSLGRFNDAKAAFRGLLDQYPSGKLVAPARYLLASTLLKERRFREAEREFVSLAADLPVSGLADGALLWAGWSALLDGRPADALPHLDGLAARFPKSPSASDAAVAEGEASFALRDYARAGRAYRTAAAATGETRIKGLIGQGWCGFATGDWGAAESAFRTALRESVDGRMKNRARVRLADALFNQKKYAEAREAYGLVVAGPEEDLARWAQLQLGWCAFRSEDPDEARRMWDQLRRRWPGTPESTLALQASAETLFQREQYASAETAFRRLSTEAGPSATDLAETAYLRIGDCRYNAKSYGPAVLAYRDYTARYPRSPRLIDALYGMQWAYLQLGDYEAARVQAREFLARFPQASLAAEVQLMVAESFRREKKPADALEQYRTLIDKYPDSDLAVSARLKSGEALEDLGRIPEADAAYAAFLEKYPKHSLAKEASFRLGLVRYAAGNYAGAVELFEKVASDVTDPRSPEALYNLLLVRKKQGDQAGMEAALKRLDRGFGRARAAAQAHLVLAYFLGDRGAKAEALPHLEAVQGCGFVDLSAEASFALGEAAAGAADKERALAEYTKGASGLPRGGEWPVQCAFAAADALAASGRHDEAIDMFRRVLEKEDATPEWMATAYYGIGQRYEATEKPAQARVMYRDCVKLKPPPDLLRAASDRLKALGSAAESEEPSVAPASPKAKPAGKPAVKPKKKNPARTGRPAAGRKRAHD